MNNLGQQYLGQITSQITNLGQLNGPSTSAPTPSVYAEVAEHWKLDAERLERARQALGAAEQELREATDGERASWSALENVSGRSLPKKDVAYAAAPTNR
jgi:hypothetical protein